MNVPNASRHNVLLDKNVRTFQRQSRRLTNHSNFVDVLGFCIVGTQTKVNSELESEEGAEKISVKVTYD